MTDTDFMLDLLNDRAIFHGACAYPDEDIGALAAHYAAKRLALDELAEELRAARADDKGYPMAPRTFWVFALEIGGCCRAFLCATQAEADAKHQAYLQTFYKDEDVRVFANCAVDEITIQPRRTASAGVDGRYALVMTLQGDFTVTIHETAQELEVAIADLREEYGIELEHEGGLFSYHAILIPQ
ncbi:hypothetical protein CA236_16955 [Sphingomonas sp. ABOLG]|uniref:hypothetical protein n=1 Tax=Sphingomonas sp. ABOLG TaxID=1985880 RepID=UPI000F7E3EDC|nr:hypothetical protein [Sphingomonas sp. ABOLG]RSV14044.1 hypothetical protein CA236_16955 [Sphingomonas sp. ABOLG]